jgi:hypothetical protein
MRSTRRRLPVESGDRDSAESSGDGEFLVNRLARRIEETKDAAGAGLN